MVSPAPRNATIFMTWPYKWFHAKNSQLFHMISDKVELYIKIVEVGEI
jgi:hypothetical protein